MLHSDPNFDFRYICRICLLKIEDDSCNSISEAVDLLTACAIADIEINENLPNNICNNCCEEIKRIHKFKILIQKSNHYFQTLIEQKETFETNVESYNTCAEELPSEDPGSPKEVFGIQKINNQYQCVVCNKEYKYQSHLKRHTYRHTDTRKHSCTVCGKSFKSPNAVRFHLRLNHLEETTILVKCPHCDKSFKKLNIQNHIRRTHRQRAKVECNLCSKLFKCQNNLNRHILREHEKVSLANILCTVCGKALESRRDLEMHLRVHTREKPHHCEMCGKNYRTPSALKKHIDAIHLQIKTHFCNICGKGFTANTSLKNHLRTHTGERPFSCMPCGRSFATKSVLNAHLKRIHNFSNKTKLI